MRVGSQPARPVSDKRPSREPKGIGLDELKALALVQECCDLRGARCQAIEFKDSSEHGCRDRCEEWFVLKGWRGLTEGEIWERLTDIHGGGI